MAGVATVLLLLISSMLMVKSSAALMRLNEKECPAFSIPHFTALLFVYLILILGFTTVYLSLELLGFSVVSVNYDPRFNEPFGAVYHIGRVTYFSMMTMLTVGYGDIIPLGLGKAIAGLQALIGYLLPAAFLASGFRSN
jgi:potassium channel LctB